MSRNTRSGVLHSPLLVLLIGVASCTLVPARGGRGPAATNADAARVGERSAQGVIPYAPDSLTVEDYARAERFLSWNAIDSVTGVTVIGGHEGAIQANWLPNDEDDRFWYDVQTERGHEFVLVNPKKKTKRPAFDHQFVADALNNDSIPATADSLPFSTFTFTPGEDSIRITVLSVVGEYQAFLVGTCPSSVPPTSGCARWTGTISPDWVPAPPPSRYQAFVEEGNLFINTGGVRDTVPLTHNGVDRYGYGTVPDECCDAVERRINGTVSLPKLAWSPDGKKIVTHHYDEREVKDLHLLETKLGRPELHSYPYALPGDTGSALPRYHYHVLDVAEGTDVQIPDTMVDGFSPETFPIHWSGDSGELFYTTNSADYQHVELVFADPADGTTQTVVVEKNNTFIDLNQTFPFRPPNWRIVRNGDAVIWFSERSGWGHLYLYPTARGDTLVSDPQPITTGDWLVLNVLHIDEREGEGKEWIYLTGVGKEAGVDPYLPQLYRVRFDGSGLTRLTQEAADHAIQISPSGNFILDTYSTRFEPSVTVLRASDGTRLMDLERVNVDRLTAGGWQMPVPFTVKADDGITDLYGFLHLPSHFDEQLEYPIVDFIYPGPQMGPILTRSFSVQPFGDVHALAELGFIVFTMDARGTPQRSKAFQDYDYGRLGDNGLGDHIAALKELDKQYPQIDLSRVGIYGHSGGGAAAAAAMLKYSEFFSVGIAGAGNHDNASYFFPWGNKYQGVDLASYPEQANQNHASKLDGKLLITYGTLDDNVHPNGTLLLIDSLIANDRDFDVLVMPNRSHGYMTEPYVIRRGWDYLVRHLLGAEPPKDYVIQPPKEGPSGLPPGG